MFDCNLIKSRSQKILEAELPTAPAFPDLGMPQPLYPVVPGSPGSLPTIDVPNNPLQPPQANPTLDYDSLQYMNGFLRTQIGKYVEVEFLVGTSNRVMRTGRLIGVGVNYILLLDVETQDIVSCDFYNIKFVKFYYRSSASIPV